MMSVMVLDDVTSFLRLKDVTNTNVQVNVCDTVQLLAGILQCNESWKKLNTSNVFSSFIVC